MGVMSNMSVLGIMSAGGYVRAGQKKHRGLCPYTHVHVTRLLSDMDIILFFKNSPQLISQSF